MKKAEFKIGNVQKIFNHLTLNLYQDVLKSGIIEIVSNAKDTMRRVERLDHPIFFTFKDNTISIKDTGEGMNEDFMLTKYTDVGYSSKTDSIDDIGMYGLGRLSIAGYDPSYKVNTIKDGIKLECLISLNESGLPDCHITKEEKTDEINGTEVLFTLQKESDIYKIKDTIKNSLLLFDNIIYSENLNIDNKYTIVEGKYFKVVNGHDLLHPKIALDNCIYPYSGQVKLPDVYLKLNLDQGVNPIPSRDLLEKTEHSDKEIEKTVNNCLKEIEEILIKDLKIRYKNNIGNLLLNNKVYESGFYIPNTEVRISFLYIKDAVQFLIDKGIIEEKNNVFEQVYYLRHSFFNIEKYGKKKDSYGFNVINSSNTYYVENRKKLALYKRSFQGFVFIAKKVINTKTTLPNEVELINQIDEFIKAKIPSADTLTIPKTVQNKVFLRVKCSTNDFKNYIKYTEKELNDLTTVVNKKVKKVKIIDVKYNDIDKCKKLLDFLPYNFRKQFLFITHENYDYTSKRYKTDMSFKEFISNKQFERLYNYSKLTYNTSYLTSFTTVFDYRNNKPVNYDNYLLKNSKRTYGYTRNFLTIHKVFEGIFEYKYQKYEELIIKRYNKYKKKYEIEDGNIYKYLYKKLKNDRLQEVR